MTRRSPETRQSADVGVWRQAVLVRRYPLFVTAVSTDVRARREVWETSLPLSS